MVSLRIEDYYLLQEAQLRVAEDNPKYMVSQQDLMDEFGISETDLDSVEVDITWSGSLNTLKLPIKSWRSWDNMHFLLAFIADVASAPSDD